MRDNSLFELIELRKSIHSEPELAGEEKKTAQKIINFISRLSPDEIIKNIGGEGIAFIFRGKEKEPVILFRCELDALPINEINEFEYKSKYAYKGHKCGHDGHMAVLAGLAQKLTLEKINKGTIVLLFQPAEETGEGAERILKDPKFSSIKPDYAFAFHNLPGYKINSVIIKEGTFASASKGMIIKLTGKISHAAEPENGINPSLAVADIIKRFSDLSQKTSRFKDFILITIIHVRIGERDFGTSPGYAELMATFRAYRNDDMKILIHEAEEIVEQIAADQKLNVNISYTEEFPATENDSECVNLIMNASARNNYELNEIREPFRWSEDFGHFTGKFRGALFGIGSGKNHPQLHNPDYDFPDEIIPVGINILYSIINEILNKK